VRLFLFFLSMVFMFGCTYKQEEVKIVPLKIEQEFRSVQQRFGEEPYSVKVEQIVFLLGKKMAVRTKGFDLRYIFDGEKEEVIVINEKEKQFFHIPFSLLSNNYYRLLLEGVRERLDQQKGIAAGMDEEERKRFEQRSSDCWKEMEALLKRPEPESVKTEVRELGELVTGHRAREIKVIADGKVVAEAVVAFDLKLTSKPLAFIILISYLPNKVRAELAKVEGFPLRYKESGNLGDLKTENETKVKELKQVKDSEVLSEMEIPNGYTKVEKPEIVESLQGLKEQTVK